MTWGYLGAGWAECLVRCAKSTSRALTEEEGRQTRHGVGVQGEL